ncbi:GTPase IMAP family member 9-like isoform 2-T3 [Pholidichthys leucotaenia]
MRVYRTYLYTKEVVYAVLVHSPANDLFFSRFPLLRDDPNAVCVYREGCFIWRPEAMCQTHSSELIHRPDLKQMEAREVTSPVFYFWDHVALALHVENRKVLRFSAARLRQNLKFCSEDDVVLENGEDFEEAKNLVKSLWPGFRAPLEEERSLLQIYSVSAIRLVLVGRTGVGKSSSGNTILGRDAFIVGGLSGTACCCLQTEQVFGRMVTIVDTPGLLATSSTTVQWEILKSINMLTPGPHAILLVLREGSFTPQDHGTVEQMEEIFGANIWTYTIIVFIEADLKVSDPERMLSEAEPELLRRVSYRTQVLNTQPQHWDGQQVYDLVQTVVKMVVVNKGKVFSI